MSPLKSTAWFRVSGRFSLTVLVAPWAALGLALPAPRPATTPASRAYAHPGGLFRCEVPSGWELAMDGAGRKFLIKHPKPATAGALELFIAIAFYRDGERYSSWEDFIAVNARGEKPRPVWVGRSTGLGFEISTRAGPRHGGPTVVRQSYAILPLRGGFVVLAYSADQGPAAAAFDESLPLFRRLLKTFKPARDPWRKTPPKAARAG